MELNFSFPRIHRLTRSKDIRCVMRTGLKLVTSSLVIYWKRVENQGWKAGFIVSARMGRAATRNRIKRCLREVVRTRSHGVGQDIWIVFIVKKELLKEQISFSLFQKELEEVFHAVEKQDEKNE